MSLQTIQHAIDSLQKASIIIVVDDEDRENEGDFICVVELITPEHVDFMPRAFRFFMNNFRIVPIQEIR